MGFEANPPGGCVNCGCGGGGQPPNTVAACGCSAIPMSLNLTITWDKQHFAYWWGSSGLTYYATDPGYLSQGTINNAWVGPGWYSPLLNGLQPGIVGQYIWFMVCSGQRLNLWVRTRTGSGGTVWTVTDGANNQEKQGDRYRTVGSFAMFGPNQTPGTSCAPYSVPNYSGAAIALSGYNDTYKIDLSGGPSGGSGSGGSGGDMPSEGDFSGE